MISYSVKGNFADAYEVNRHVNIISKFIVNV